MSLWFIDDNFQGNKYFHFYEGNYYTNWIYEEDWIKITKKSFIEQILVYNILSPIYWTTLVTDSILTLVTCSLILY